MNGKSLFIFLLLLVVLTSRIVASASDKPLDKNIVKLLIETSKEINAQLPTMVDEETRMDATMAVGNQMHYKYTLIHTTETNIDKKSFTKKMKSIAVTNQCNTPNMLQLLKMGITYHYMYQDKNGIILSTINISKKDCGL